MQLQTGVICSRSPSGDFLDDEEPIFEEFDDAEIEDPNAESSFNPFDEFINYISEKMIAEGRV